MYGDAGQIRTAGCLPHTRLHPHMLRPLSRAQRALRARVGSSKYDGMQKIRIPVGDTDFLELLGRFELEIARVSTSHVIPQSIENTRFFHVSTFFMSHLTTALFMRIREKPGKKLPHGRNHNILTDLKQRFGSVFFAGEKTSAGKGGKNETVVVYRAVRGL